jgi:hypothetical protein
MKRKWHHNKPAKRGPTTKLRPGKEGITQRQQRDHEGAAKLHSGDWSICPYDHFKPYIPQSWDILESGQKKPLLKENNLQTHLVFAKRHIGDSPNIWKKVLWSIF